MPGMAIARSAMMFFWISVEPPPMVEYRWKAYSRVHFPRSTESGPPRAEQPGRPQQVDGQLGQRLRHRRPRQLGERHLGPVLLALHDLGERAQRQQAGQLDLGPHVRDAVPQRRVLQRARVHRARRRDHGAQVGGQDGDLRRDADALVAERAHGHHPAGALLAEAPRRRDAHVGEEDLVEQLLARHVADRPHVDPRRLHVEDEGGDPLVLLPPLDRRRVRPQQEQPPRGQVGGARSRSSSR